MRPGDRTTIPTVAQAMRDASAICDPDGIDTVVTALLEGFEDDERPVTAAEDLERELSETVEEIDPETDSPAARVAAACTVWLATNPEQADNPDHALREASLLAFGDDVPPEVADWLNERGIAL